MKEKKEKKFRVIVILVGIVILMGSGGYFLWQWNAKWESFDVYDLEVERIVFTEVSTLNDEDIVFVLQWDESRTALNYMPGHYIVRTRQAGRFKYRLDSWTYYDRYEEFSICRTDVEVIDALTGELVRVIDVLELVEGLGEAIEGYRMERLAFQTFIHMRDGGIMLSWPLRENPREGLPYDWRELRFLTLNYQTGEVEVYPGSVFWDVRRTTRRSDERNLEFEIQMSIFEWTWIFEGERDRKMFTINGMNGDIHEGVFVRTPFPGIAEVSLMATDLPEESESLYSRFPGLIYYRGNEGLRVRFMLSGYPTPEEILEMLMEDGREISFEGLVMCGDSSIDGEEHEINTFEDYMRLRDRSRWGVEEE